MQLGEKIHTFFTLEEKHLIKPSQFSAKSVYNSQILIRPFLPFGNSLPLFTFQFCVIKMKQHVKW